MKGRRGLTVAVIACALASALVVYAASRVWGEVVTQRPAPFPPLVTRRTGSSLAPWLPALGIVGLAGAGALVATRGPVRAVVGALLALCGAGTVAVALLPLGNGADARWPIVCVPAGLVVAAAGVFTIRNSRDWPAMGARYERPTAKESRQTDDKPLTQAELWDALDRGEDPTH